jgi:cell fate regulator YaaT (PSP1 superfamily)
MKEKEIYPENNEFFSRGCCAVPSSQNNDESNYKPGCAKLSAYDWLKDIDLSNKGKTFDCIEVRFKNSRKDFYRVPPEMNLHTGDVVAVEASPGHDIGIVSLTGEVVRVQMIKKAVDFSSDSIRKVYRKARPTDIDKWIAAVSLEHNTMIKTRQIARNLGLQMKINDVEYQGDRTKAIFYYTADDRVDFRELIKKLAEEFKVRIEMKQIGIRQEASRMGGIGSCGKELCCSSWLTDFTSVSTSAARIQQLSLNPQKLAGQCGKLKCCLNYETDQYIEALNRFPDSNIILQTKKGNARYQKTDVFRSLMWYTYENDPGNFVPIHYKNVQKIINLNKRKKVVENLEDFAHKDEKEMEGGFR